MMEKTPTQEAGVFAGARISTAPAVVDAVCPLTSECFKGAQRRPTAQQGLARRVASAMGSAPRVDSSPRGTSNSARPARSQPGAGRRAPELYGMQAPGRGALVLAGEGGLASAAARPGTTVPGARGSGGGGGGGSAQGLYAFASNGVPRAVASSPHTGAAPPHGCTSSPSSRPGTSRPYTWDKQTESTLRERMLAGSAAGLSLVSGLATTDGGGGGGASLGGIGGTNGLNQPAGQTDPRAAAWFRTHQPLEGPPVVRRHAVAVREWLDEQARGRGA
ncbi:hypothetical protein FOA52_009268 [Chlamydomonas sp. UWO 241]|nr:hypothetical protein FOA52_009268 [Chlamydomonas sp. UWO 241]